MVKDTKSMYDPVFAYLHIPKTGGSSLNKLAYMNYRLSEVEPEDKIGAYINGVIYTDRIAYPLGFFTGCTGPTDAYDELAGIAATKPVTALLGHFSFGVDQYLGRRCIYATVLRDPIERVLSLASHFRKWDYGPLGENKYGPYIEIGRTEGRDFVDVLRQYPLPEFSNDQTRRLTAESLEFGAKDGWESLVKASLHNVPVIGLTERFSETLVLFSDRLGWDMVSVYERKLTNDQRLQVEALSAQDLDWLRSINQVDLRLYERAVAEFDSAMEALGSDARHRAENIEERRWDLG